VAKVTGPFCFGAVNEVPTVRRVAWRGGRCGHPSRQIWLLSKRHRGAWLRTDPGQHRAPLSGGCGPYARAQGGGARHSPLGQWGASPIASPLMALRAWWAWSASVCQRRPGACWAGNVTSDRCGNRALLAWQRLGLWLAVDHGI